MKTFFILLLLAVLLSCGKKSQEDQSFKSIDALSSSSYVILMNDYRMRMGLAPLIYSKAIEISASEHSREMALGNRPFGHEGWKERCKFLRAELKSKSCGEIVAVGQKSDEDVLESWLSSAPHRNSIEKPDWTHTGVGVFRNKNGRLFWTQIFLKLQ